MTDAAGGGMTASALAPALPDAAPVEHPSPSFAHGSEAEMARILDFYGVRWEYEPRTFPILWNLEGDVIESFSPDFYLPDLELYLEMTTLRQRLVRKKNRKLRRLRELYPDIRIKLFYARDFRAMLLKYGRLGLADSLSGTLGQLSGTLGQVLPEVAGPAGAASGPSSTTPGPSNGASPAPGVRRSASRSRRRRAAAAARSAVRLGGAPATAVHDEEERGPR
jgi:hypothetical protein